MAEPTKKLYRVTLKGMHSDYGISYVVAYDLTEAYAKVRKFLDDHDIGFSKYRELDRIELLADATQYSGCGTILYL